ncbi:nitrate reductase molybdenum cofactor assembly chaperone [uncultured Microbulbifer sp.]|uniref:nitrate reductase molybdenum cofactor assembly chaperone n=1 Tax=uncultured Microbulbifer sp. TaxID=348147 RepID=UPI0025D59C32|nr:nitrate reductase molybdenum cofactor assembly chaperone [uncultured Microbulbifer sp.]
MKTLQLISRLLDYPDEALAAHLAELTQFVAGSEELGPSIRNRLLCFIAHYESRELLDWQSEYDGLFERGRAVSLHIFEHIYGESRDRGQAMVELLKQYRNAGLELAERELPDYLPTYLEFCATQEDAARAWLQEISHVLALLAARLRDKESVYAELIDALVDFTGVEVDRDGLAQQVAKEERDDTPEALDKIWEEEVVSFSAAQGSACEQSVQRPSAAQFRDDKSITWVDAANHTAAHTGQA